MNGRLDALIWFLAEERGRDPLRTFAKKRRDVINAMGPAAVGTYQYWVGSADSQPVDPRPTQPHQRDTPKVGRNDLCPCGSGKKYKRCCLQ